MEHRAGSKSATRSISWIAVGVLWIIASFGGMVLLAVYANSPGSLQPPPLHWPAESSIGLSESGATLLMFAHPHCPCTRASLGELERIVAKYQGAVTPWVVFFRPAEADDTWDQTDLRRKAAAIPGAYLMSDLEGIEARRFQAMTSGQTVLYSDQGRLLFHGGITPARGHAGDNTGRSAIESWLSGAVSSCRETAVFGCPIAVPFDKN